MKFSVQLPIHWRDTPETFNHGGKIASLAAEIEQAGFDACFVTEHPAPSLSWLESGGHHTLDPFVALSFAGAGTTHLRLHTNILVLSYRNPLLTAKAVASLDVLSQGRVICGVGVGYMQGEFAALGADFQQRGKASDEALEVMKAAWTGEPVTYDGIGFDAYEAVVQPRCAQRPHPPLWIGGNSEHAIRRAVRYGDAWTPFPTSRAGVTAALPDINALKQRIGIAREISDQYGRQTSLDICMVPFGWSMNDTAEVDSTALVDQLHCLRELGVTWAVLALEANSEQQYRERLQALGEDVLAPIREGSV